MCFTRIGSYVSLLSLVVACQMIRTLPEPVPLDFGCQAQIAQPTLYVNSQPKTKIILTLTPNSEGTRASSLSLTDWSLPEGLRGLLLDSAGHAVTRDTPLSWGNHVWWYSPHNTGEHTITLHLGDAYQQEPLLIALPPIQVLGSAAAAETTGAPVSISAWTRALSIEEQAQVQGGDKEVVALEVRLEEVDRDLEEASFHLQGWELPEGLSGVLENTAAERLNAFPLQPGASNTLFLSLDKGHHLQEEQVLRLWIQGPRGMSIEKEVPLTWRQTSFPFGMTLKATPTTLFSHQEATLTLTITPADKSQATDYRITALTLSDGTLQGKESGVVLAPGALLGAGEHQLLFACPDIAQQTPVHLSLSVSNTQGDSKTLEQVLVVKPLQFSVTTWLRALNEEERKQIISEHQEGVAIEVRLEEVPAGLEEKPFTLQDCALPAGFEGRLVNQNQAPLHFFPLSAEEANTLYLVFAPTAVVEGDNPVIAFQVRGPGGQLIAGQVAGTVLQQQLLQCQMERTLKAIDPLDRNALAENRAHLEALEALGEQVEVPQDMREQLDSFRPLLAQAQALEAALTAYGSEQQAVHALCAQGSLSAQEKIALQQLMEQAPGMLVGQGVRPLRVAAYHMNLEAVKVLLAIPLAIGKDAETPTMSLLSGFITTCYAQSRKQEEQRALFDALFDALIEVPALLEEADSIGRRPLMFAAGVGDVNLVKKLVNKGADVSAATTKQADYDLDDDCWVERYRFFMTNSHKRGGTFKRVWGWTAIHEATAKSQWECVRFLNGLDVRWPSPSAYHYYDGSSNNINRIYLRSRGFYVE